MPRRPLESAEPIGSDSFLDVITNVVGIMIVLVMVVGMKAGQTAAQATNSADGQGPAAAEKAAADEAALASTIRQTEQERQQLVEELNRRNAEREQLMFALTVADQELEAQRTKLAEPNRVRFDQEQAISALKNQLARLDRERIETLATERKVEKLLHNPTPLSQVVTGKEIHFQLQHGRIAYVPFDDLLEKMGYVIRDKRSQLGPAELARYSDTVGPIDGFRLHFQLTPVGAGSIGLGLASFLPERNDLGETLTGALADNSAFRRALAKGNARDTAVTLWTYPDCDKEYQALNKALHELGYAVAARPMPTGVPISGSHKGSRSSSQ